MADSIPELITKNLEAAIHGKSITIASVSKTITCERERFVNVIGDRYPFGALQGPFCDVMSRAHLIAQCNLYYVVTLCDAIADDYNPTVAVDPVTKVVGNAASDLVKLVMLDRTRGGYATDTTWEGFDYFINSDGDTPEMYVTVQFAVKCFLRDSDPYFTGG